MEAGTSVAVDGVPWHEGPRRCVPLSGVLPAAPRRRVAWARSGCTGGLRTVITPVATLPARVVLPRDLSGDTLRVCQLVCAGTSVFLTGPPGAGKSHLLRQAINALRASGVTLAACASSGVAAVILGGVTAHSWAGFIHGDADLVISAEQMVQHVIPAAAKSRMRAAMVLMVDEIGTLSAAFVDCLDLVLREVRQSARLFGGLVIVFSGDFLQLPPPRGSYAISFPSWGKVFGNKAVQLASNWRHGGDPVFTALLSRLRVGAHTAKDLELLHSRKVDEAPSTAVWLTTHTMLADAKNREELDKLPGPDVICVATDVAVAPYLSAEQATTLLNECLKVRDRMALRVGAMVIVPSSSLSDRGVPSGTRGVVKMFCAVGCGRFPVVRFFLPSGRHHTMLVAPVTSKVVALDGHSTAASRTQVPLVLGWACTVHRAQGWTLPDVAVDLKDAFSAGHVLFAISRAPRLEGVHLMSFDSDNIIVDELAVAFHSSLVSL